MNQADFHYPITATLIMNTTEGVTADEPTYWDSIDSLDQHLNYLEREEADIKSASAVVTRSPVLTELHNQIAALTARMETAETDSETRTLLEEHHNLYSRLNSYQVRKTH